MLGQSCCGASYVVEVGKAQLQMGPVGQVNKFLFLEKEQSQRIDRVGPEQSWVETNPNLSRQTLANRSLGISEELSLGRVWRPIIKEIRGIYSKSRGKGPKSVISKPMGIMMTL